MIPQSYGAALASVTTNVTSVNTFVTRPFGSPFFPAKSSDNPQFLRIRNWKYPDFELRLSIVLLECLNFGSE